MKRNFLLCLLFLLTLSSKGQVLARFYYDQNWRLVKKDSLVYFRDCVFDSANQVFTGVVKDYYKDGKLMMEGSYDKGIKRGVFTTYYPDGSVESQGTIEDNMRQGLWVYFHRNGKSKQKILFANERGKIFSYNDSTGHALLINGNGQWVEEYELPDVREKLVNEGFFKDFYMEGDWISRTESGRILFKERYKKGAFVYGIEYNTKGKRENVYYAPLPNKLMRPFKFAMTESLEFGKDVTTEYSMIRRRQAALGTSDFPESDRGSYRIMADDTIPEGNARPVCGLQKFYDLIMQEIRYPAKARANGVEGKVYVEFMVTQEAAFKEFRVIKGIGYDCDEEAVRVIKAVVKKCKWIAGERKGHLVSQRYTMAIGFRLG